MAKKKETIHQKLNYIQTRLKVEKGRTNSFGKYKYRNLDDIFEALKPLLKETESIITVTDEIVCVNGFNYIKARVNFMSENDDGMSSNIYSEGWAREPVTRKGMDDSQITGSTSSYARKYAMNGLFAIDDTADADSMDNTNHQSGQLSRDQVNTLLEMADKVDKETVTLVAKKVDDRSIDKSNYEASIKKLEGMLSGK
tara:strand:+ start:254 stop:847 length:594 start_codon:yes stop_codon:yes gene_type:complete